MHRTGEARARAPVDNSGFFESKENVNVSSNAHADQHQLPCVLRQIAFYTRDDLFLPLEYFLPPHRSLCMDVFQTMDLD